MSRRAHRFALAALVLLVLAGCTAGPSTRPAVIENDGPQAPASPGGTTPPAPLPDLEQPLSEGISWSGCDGETRARVGAESQEANIACARISTTLDAPDLPRRGVMRIALLKAGEGPIPLVVVNDIGGEPGTIYAARLAATLPPELLETFSLIGVDRRGTGKSDPVRCIPAASRTALLDHDPAQPVEPALDAARSAGQQCAIGLEEEQGALDSWRAAGDLDELRQQLGTRHLNAIGHGDGSRVLTTYAARFPQQVGRFLLDGVPNPSDDRAAVLEGVAQGAEAALDAFAEDCAAREGCPLDGDARAAVTRLAESARTSPLLTGDGTRMGPALTLRAVLAGLADRQRWPELGSAVAAAAGGDGAGLAGFVEPQLTGPMGDAPRFDATLATTCNDTRTRLPADQLESVVRDLGEKYPAFGGVIAQELVWCSPWPARRDTPPTLEGSVPPMVVVSTAVDPVTPETGTVRAAEQLPTAVRVAWQGAGHDALGSECVAETARAFLVDGKVPRDGTLCPA